LRADDGASGSQLGIKPVDQVVFRLDFNSHYRNAGFPQVFLFLSDVSLVVNGSSASPSSAGLASGLARSAAKSAFSKREFLYMKHCPESSRFK
jgi:hypothetical protein